MIITRVLRIQGFAKNMIRIESHGFANLMDSHGFAVLRTHANPKLDSQKRESMQIPGFAWIWRILDSQRLGICKMEILQIHGFARQNNLKVLRIQILGFARFGVYANPGIRTYANPCESKYLLKLNFANPDSHECESRCESKCKSQSSWVQNYLILCH